MYVDIETCRMLMGWKDRRSVYDAISRKELEKDPNSKTTKISVESIYRLREKKKRGCKQ